MKRYLFIIILFVCAAVPMTAQYYSVNYDKRTVAEMTAAFASEAATEAYYAEQVAKIREYYQAAEVAAAGIFTSKFLDTRVPPPPCPYRLRSMDKLHRELLLPTHLQHGLRQDYAQDLDCGRHDVA